MVVLGPLISDNSLVVQDTANELGVACIGWTGAHRFASDYCFTVANGDIPTEGVMCAQWMAEPRLPQGRHVLGAGQLRQGLRRLLPRHRAAARAAGRARGEARAQPEGARRRPAHDARPRRRDDLLRRLRLRDVPLRGGVQGARLGPAAGDGHRVHVLFELQRVGRGPRGLARRRPARRGRRQRQLQRHGRALREALRPHHAQRGRGARLRHRPRRHPRHRQRRHPAPALGEGGDGAHPLDAGHQRRARHLHPVRPARPQGLQGRLPHHPGAARRRAPLRRLPPARSGRRTRAPARDARSTSTS